MKKISIVILNYLNYWDTIECIDSILDMGYEFEGIVVVDNNSKNESCRILKRRYEGNEKIAMVRAGKNYGFAKGNNIGISVARKKFHTDFVLAVNNDVVFKQKDYLQRLLRHYEHGIGMIGSEIHLKGNAVQKENIYDISLQGAFKLLFDLTLRKIDENIWSFLKYDVEERKLVKVLHGCAILFTPDFFKYYAGFYERTFLYAEEPILYLMCKRRGLLQLYARDAYIYHKEDQSSEASFKNNEEIMEKYRRQSYKHLIYWIAKDKLIDAVRSIRGIKDGKVVYKSALRV